MPAKSTQLPMTAGFFGCSFTTAAGGFSCMKMTRQVCIEQPTQHNDSSDQERLRQAFARLGQAKPWPL
jgi:hypothetical protein